MNGSGAPSGRLLCIEGGDGAGKTALARRATDALRRRGAPAVLVEKRACATGDAFLDERLAHLQTVLWDYPREAPIHEWGDPHWLHLLASWFALWDRARVRPFLARGDWVVVDGWIYKYVTRFSLKPCFTPEYVRRCFEHVSVPDAVVLLDVPPVVAAGRRPAFKATETGALDGLRGGSREDFIQYQGRVVGGLRAMAAELAWTVLDGTLPQDELLSCAVDALLGKVPVNQTGR